MLEFFHEQTRSASSWANPAEDHPAAGRAAGTISDGGVSPGRAGGAYAGKICSRGHESFSRRKGPPETACPGRAPPRRRKNPVARARHSSNQQQQRQTQTSGPRTRERFYVVILDSTTEIPQKSWKIFCDLLKEWHRGAISLFWTQPDGIVRDIFDDLPLQTVFFQKQDKCNDVITIEAGQWDERPQQYRIVDPIRVVLKRNDESGRYKQLEILSETGKTEVSFSPGIDAAMLEKIAA
jgi:hypothetical protein